MRLVWCVCVPTFTNWTIKTAIPLVASIVNSLRNFNDFLKLNPVFRADETYERYEADTEADKVAPHRCYVCGSFYTFFLYGVLLQWLAKTFLITLLQKGLICTKV